MGASWIERAAPGFGSGRAACQASPAPGIDLRLSAPLPSSSQRAWRIDVATVGAKGHVTLGAAVDLHGWGAHTLLVVEHDRDDHGLVVCEDRGSGRPLLRDQRLLMPLAWRRRHGVDVTGQVVMLTHRDDPLIRMMSVALILDAVAPGDESGFDYARLRRKGR